MKNHDLKAPKSEYLIWKKWEGYIDYLVLQYFDDYYKYGFTEKWNSGKSHHTACWEYVVFWFKRGTVYAMNTDK